jgi:hypothetical protein
MENTPEERPAQGSQQQATPPDGFIEIARYNGLVRKVDELVKADRTKDDQITQLKGEIERYQANLVEKDASVKVAVSERDKRLEEIVTQKSEMEAELRRLKALEAKVQVANEIGHPELLGAIKNLPDLENKDALKMIFEDIAKFADSKAKAREEQLLAGVTLPASGVKTNSINNTPTTEAEWEGYLAKQELGTPEYQKALDAYWDFQIKKH